MSQSEYFLRLSRDFSLQPTITYEQAVSILIQAYQVSANVPYAMSLIDKPNEGEMHIVFLHPQLPHLPPDGVRFLEQEQRYAIQVPPHRELEVFEVKFGFVPGGGETAASRVRRRFRLSKGGHPNIILLHYSRGPSHAIPQQILHQPIRAYPLRPSQEPPVFVLGEKAGQKVFPVGHPQQHHGHGHPHGHMPLSHPSQLQAQMHASHAIAGDRHREQALMAVASQNSVMENALRREKDRGVRPGRPAVEEDAGVGDEENITFRALALARFKRNHEHLAELFSAVPISELPVPPSPYASLNKESLEAQLESLNAEIEGLKQKAAERERESQEKSQLEAGDIAMVTA